MFKLIRKDEKIVIVQRNSLGIWVTMSFGILYAAVTNARQPWAVVAVLLASLGMIAVVYKERRMMIDPAGRAFTVKESGFLRGGEFQTYFFDDLAKPIELVEESPITGKYLRATMKDGTVIDITQPRRRGDLNAATAALDEINRAIFGPRLSAKPAAPGLKD